MLPASLASNSRGQRTVAAFVVLAVTPCIATTIAGHVMHDFYTLWLHFHVTSILASYYSRKIEELQSTRCQVLFAKLDTNLDPPQDASHQSVYK